MFQRLDMDTLSGHLSLATGRKEYGTQNADEFTAGRRVAMRIIGMRSVLVIASLFLLAATAHSQIEFVSGSAFRGERIFGEKGCINCHSVNGAGGTTAPDLAERSACLYSPELLASVM